MKIPLDIKSLTEDQAKDLLIKIVAKLDELACEDFFGTEGWEKFMGIEDC